MAHRVIVVGGGVIGCSIAYQLATAGASVALIERDGIGSHASGRNPGNLNPILGADPDLVPFALESLQLHRALAPELAALGCTPYRIEPVKRVLLAFDDKDRQELDAVAREGTVLVNLTGGDRPRTRAAESVRWLRRGRRMDRGAGRSVGLSRPARVRGAFGIDNAINARRLSRASSLWRSPLRPTA